jgi:hypothetical protein
VRYDQYDGSGPLPQFNMEFDDFSPRLGVTYSFTPAWQIQATYGKYISRFNDNVANSATGVSNAPRIETRYTGPSLRNLTREQVTQILRDDRWWTVVTAYVDPLQPTTYLADDINAPFADDYNLSLRHALPRNSGSVVLSYIHRDYNDLLDDFTGFVCSGQGFCEATDTTNVTAPGGARFPLDTTVWANNPNATREYRALTAVWDYRPTSRWQLTGNYTYSTTEGNYEGEARNQPSSGSPMGNYPLTSVNVAPFGYTDDDIRHRVNILSAYSFDFNRAGALTLGTILYYQSGRAWSQVATVASGPNPGYVSNPASYTRFFGERGNQRFNDWWQWDLSARYELPIFSDFNVFLKAAVTNVLNNDEVIQHAVTGRAVRNTDGTLSWVPARSANEAAQGICGLGNEPSPNCSSFGRIRNEFDYQTPRSYLLTVAFDF